MNSKLKLLMLSFILIGLVSGSVFATENLEFQAAVKLMEENDLELKIAKLNLDTAQLDYDKAVASNIGVSSVSSAMQAEFNLEQAKHSYQNALNSRYLDLLRKYTDIQSNQRTLDIRKVETIIAEHEHKIVLEKIRMGDAGRLDELRETNRLNNARLSEQIARDSLDESMRVLRQSLGLTEDTYNLTTEFKLPELEFTLEQSIEIALDNSFEIWRHEYNLELDQLALDKARIDGTPPIDIRRLELEKQIAELQLQQARTDLVEDVTSSFSALEQSLAQYNGAEREYEIAAESHSISKRQAEAGLITDIQLEESRLDLREAEQSRQDALVSYIINYLQFKQLLGMDGRL